MTKVEWPDLSFGPVNLWVVIPAKEFYELMERYHIPKEEYEQGRTIGVLEREP